jgi:4'-phosphopantetheinyl transferase
MERDEIHIWYVFSDQVTDPVMLARCEELLAPDEKERNQRFLVAGPRHQHLIARALIRTTLSRYADFAPNAWIFTANRYGRPEIAGPAGVPPLRFNLSHTKGLVACIVALDREVGIDVENVERPGGYVDLARRYFSISEAAHVASLPADGQQEAFFDYWTLKEAYIKARGMGLALPLVEFAFCVGDAITIEFSGSMEDDPQSWQFERWRIGSRHKMAIAVRRAQEALKIIVREARLFEQG